MNRRTRQGLDTSATVRIAARPATPERSIFPQEQNPTGMIRQGYLKEGGSAPEVRLSGWQSAESAPVFEMRGVAAPRPGFYPELDEKGYVQTVPLRESLIDFETRQQDYLASKGSPWDNSPPIGDVMLQGKTWNPISAETLLSQEIPEIGQPIRGQAPRYVTSPNERYQAPFYEKPEQQLFPQSELADPDWTFPASQIAVGSNQSLSMAPNPLGNLVAYTAPGQRGFRTAPQSMVEGLVDAGRVRIAPTRDVTEQVVAGSNPVPPAFRSPDQLPVRGGYDITTESNTADFMPSTWEKNVTVQLPSTVLADKGLSPYALTTSSQYDAGDIGLQRYQIAPIDADQATRDRIRAANLTNKAELINTDPNMDYVQVKQRGDTYQYLEPMRDAQYVRDRLASSQRSANMGYANERNRVAASNVGMTPAKVSSAAILQNALGQGGMSPELTQRLQGVRDQLGDIRGIDTLSQKQFNRDEYGRRVAFTDNAIANAYNQLGNPPDVEMTRVTEVLPNPGGNPDIIVDRVPLSVEQRLNEARDFRERGFTQAATALPNEGSVGSDNLNSYYVFPQYSRRMSTGADGNRYYTNSEGSTLQVYDLSPEQKMQINREIANGQRKVAPIGTTNPGANVPNEIYEAGVGLNRSQELPIQRGNFSAEEDSTYLDHPVMQPRYDTTAELNQRTAGQRLRGEVGYVETPVVVDQTGADIAAYTAGQIQRKRLNQSTYTPLATDTSNMIVSNAPNPDKNLPQKEDGYARERIYPVAAQLQSETAPFSRLKDEALSARAQALLQQKFGDNWRNYLVQ